MALSLGGLLLGTPREMTAAEIAQLDPTTNQVINGTLYTWRPSQIDDGQGNQIDNPDETPGNGGSWVPADTHVDPNIAKQLGRFVAVTSAVNAGAQALSGGAGVGGSGAAPGSLPVGTAQQGINALQGAATTTTGLGAAPAAVAGGASAAGGAAAAVTPVATAAKALAGAGGGNAFAEALKVLGPIAGKYALDKLTTKPLTDATNKANAAEQAATNRALDANKAAAKVAGNVYLQQRQDLQNQWGNPYQTLGQMMGLSIPQIGSGANVVNASIPGALPAGNGVPSGINPAVDGPNPAVTPSNPMGLGPGLTVGTVKKPRTLAELQAMGGR